MLFTPQQLSSDTLSIPLRRLQLEGARATGNSIVQVAVMQRDEEVSHDFHAFLFYFKQQFEIMLNETRKSLMVKREKRCKCAWPAPYLCSHSSQQGRNIMQFHSAITRYLLSVLVSEARSRISLAVSLLLLTRFLFPLVLNGDIMVHGDLAENLPHGITVSGQLYNVVKSKHEAEQTIL